MSEDKTNWDSWVPFATYVYNTTKHSATRFTLFELLFGRSSTLPCTLNKPTEIQYNYDEYASELKGRLQTVHQHAHKSQEHYDKTAGSTKLQAGDRVLLVDETVRRGRSRKLSAQSVGPFTIIYIDKVNATIATGHKSTKININRLKLFY